MSLRNVEIEGFKSIRELSLDLHQMNLMIGANGAGKSNLVAAFGLLQKIVEGQCQDAVRRAGGASTLLHNGPKATTKIRLKLDFGRNAYEAILAPADADDSLFFENETAWGQGAKYDRAYEVPLGHGHLETKLPQEAKRYRGGVASHVLSTLKSWRVYHFHDTSGSALVKKKGPLDDNASLRPDASNLAAFLYRLHETDEDAFQRITETVRQVAPFFGEFRLRPDPLKEGTIQLEWSHRDSEAYWGAHALSDGTLRFICLATLLLQPEPPSLVLIDEPELGLHPFAITLLAGLLQSAATTTQLLVGTQSVTLMNQFEPEDVVVVDRLDDQSSFRRIGADEVERWSDAYALGELWEKNVIGGRPQR